MENENKSFSCELPGVDDAENKQNNNQMYPLPFSQVKNLEMKSSAMMRAERRNKNYMSVHFLYLQKLKSGSLLAYP